MLFSHGSITASPIWALATEDLAVFTLVRLYGGF